MIAINSGYFIAKAQAGHQPSMHGILSHNCRFRPRFTPRYTAQAPGSGGMWYNPM
jgi:hypothetical protein